MACNICFERDVNIALNPCGHTYCEECSTKINKCSICRQEIIGKIKIFLNEKKESNNTSLLSLDEVSNTLGNFTIAKEILTKLISLEEQMKRIDKLVKLKQDDLNQNFKNIELKIDRIANKLLKEIDAQRKALKDNFSKIKDDLNSGLKKNEKNIKEKEGKLKNIQQQLKQNLNHKQQLELIEKLEELNLDQDIEKVCDIDATLYDIRELNVKMSFGELVNKSHATLNGHSAPVVSLAILSNDKLVSGSEDNKIKIWNLNSNKCIRTLEGHFNCVKSLAVLLDKIVSASSDKTIRIWNSINGQCIKTLNGHGDSVNVIKFLTKIILVSGSDDRTIKVWDFNTGECIKH